MAFSYMLYMIMIPLWTYVLGEEKEENFQVKEAGFTLQTLHMYG